MSKTTQLVAGNLKNVIPPPFSLLHKCKSMAEAASIHALHITLGISDNESFTSALISSAPIAHPCNPNLCHRILLQFSNRVRFHWNIVIRSYSKSRNPNNALLIFVKMLRWGMSPDYLTFPFLAKASAHMAEFHLTQSIHAQSITRGYHHDLFIQNSIIHSYASCRSLPEAQHVFEDITNKNSVSWNTIFHAYAVSGDMSHALQIFTEMPGRDVVSWSSLIDGYVKIGDHRKALAMFDKMRAEGPPPNQVTMVSILNACAQLGAYDYGKKMHQYMMHNQLPLNLKLQTCLVDMYAKCGAIDEALFVFRQIPLAATDVLVWNSMIGGLAIHGMVVESLDMFREMERGGVFPDEITFLSLLVACAHGGLVDKAKDLFKRMRELGMEEKDEHYACMVSVLTRAGRLTEAYQFITEALPNEPSSSMLGALVSGCLSQRRVDLVEKVRKKLIEVDPNHDGRYVGLSNVYAVVKRWDEAKWLREAMEKRGVVKSPGFSFVEINGVLHRFISHDCHHLESVNVYRMLNFIIGQMKLKHT